MFKFSWLKKVVSLVLLLFVLGCGADALPPEDDDIIGNWAVLQAVNSYYNKDGASIGDAIFNKDGTFHVWNAIKKEDYNCYVIEEAAGTWTKISPGHYRGHYGDYFYEALFTHNVGTFMLMSTVDSNDIGLFEYGNLYKDISIDPIKDWYRERVCS